MSSKVNPKLKFKAFFKTNEASESAIELLRQFIIPFSRAMPKAGIDDMLSAFFALDERRFFYAKALRDFKMPGKYYVAGNRPIYGLGPRKVTAGERMLIAVDRKEGTARVELGLAEDSRMYLLEKFEFETIKDWVHVIE